MHLLSFRTAAAGALAASLLTGCGSGAGDSSSSPQSPAAESPVTTADVEPVADWLAGEVGSEGFVEGEYVDHGLTLDFAETLADAGGHEEVVTRILDAMQDPREVAGYVSFYDERANGQYAGATAKLVHTVVTAGRDPADYRGDLVDDLVDMVVTSGPEAGRARDTGKTDYSNTVSQSYVVRAFAVTGTDEPLAQATAFLLGQQCDDGWFRESLVAGPSGESTCETGAVDAREPSVDATAHAVMALLEVGERLDGDLGARADGAVEAAIGWLEGIQDEDGGFSVSGDDAAANANSTGLAAEALAAAGRPDAAALAAHWLLEHAVTQDAQGRLATEVGAVAFDDKALAQARRRGIKPADRARWQRSTAEAAGGMHSVAAE